MDIYENVLIGNFLYCLGAAVTLRAPKETDIPMCINLIQQTPMDQHIGDVMLNNTRFMCIIEFKRHSNKADKEREKLSWVRRQLAASRRPELERLSREVHWYFEHEARGSELISRAVPYLDFQDRAVVSLDFLTFVQRLAHACAVGEQNLADCKAYLDLLKRPAAVGTSTGGLVVTVQADGRIGYAVLADFRDLRLTRQALEDRQVKWQLFRHQEMVKDHQRELTRSRPEPELSL